MLKRIYVLLFGGLLLSCQGLAQKGPDKPVSAEYQACCGVQPVEFTFAKKQIYVPNVFTPNGDGVNDYFMPYINQEVASVWGFTILSAKGDTVLYLMPYFDYSTEKDITRYAWNGRRQDGSLYKGLFKYRMRVDDKLANKDVIEGTACALLCGPEVKVFQTKEGCFFPVQAGLEGKKAFAQTNQETGCF